MNPQSEEDLQRRLQQLEAEVNYQSKSPVSESKQTSLLSWLNWKRWQLWFNGLSGTNKLVFLGVAALLGLSIVQMVLKLLVSALSLALLAGLVYLGYKFFVSGNSHNK
ncbi:MULTISPECIES: hypothetical protein [unclassified Anabaena]|uniref:hypothetical protein n=1 Tax=unclassified Anabaena TaxID=2619674 RepID=UPI00082E150A|nr:MULTISPECIES: hypothetical protein [unclassified Anabaena]